MEKQNSYISFVWKNILFVHYEYIAKELQLYCDLPGAPGPLIVSHCTAKELCLYEGSALLMEVTNYLSLGFFLRKRRSKGDDKQALGCSIV